jgi:hypothetical protein
MAGFRAMPETDFDSDDEGEVPPLLGMDALSQQQQRETRIPPTKVPQAPPPCAMPAAKEQPSLAAAGSGSTPSAAETPPSSGAEGELTGQLVQIYGLAARPELNGRTADAGRWLREKQRYDVRVGGATLAIRPANLRPVPTAARPAAGVNAAGIKKGFLGGDCRRAGWAGTSEGGCGAGSIPHVRGDGEGGKSSLQLPEVQARMQEGGAAAAAAGTGGGKEGWVTPELLSKIAADPLLRKAFTDPR